MCEVYVPSLPSLHTRGTVHIIVQGRQLLVLSLETIASIARCASDMEPASGRSLKSVLCACVSAGGPEIVGEEQEVQLEEAEGRLVNLSCEASGHPLPSITWSVTGSQVGAVSWHLEFVMEQRGSLAVWSVWR